MEVDFRFDAPPAAPDAAVGVFPAYQDEGNWAAWVWHPGSGHAGFQREVHFGRANAGVSRDATETWLAGSQAETGRWYRVRLLRDGRKLAFELTDKATGRRLAADTRELDLPGCFPALGSRGVKASFDNFSLRER